MGTTKNAIHNLLGWDRVGNRHSQIVNANNVLFSSFGTEITASEIVKTAIHRVAEEISKCSLKSVVEKNDPRRVTVCDDSINAVFSGRVNKLCGLKDFLYKIVYLLLVNRNCFIYWAYDEVPIKGTDKVRRVTRGFYPIENANVRLYYLDGELRTELSTTAGGGIVLDLPYSDLIHIRNGYGANAFLGGNASGRADFREILGNLQTLHVIKEAIPKSLEASLSLKGVLTLKTVADADKREVKRETFEDHLFNSRYGIVATDYESDFQPINIQTQDIPSNVLSFIRDEILSPFGVSLPIYLGKYTDEDYTAFWQTACEGITLAITDAFRIVLFTPHEIKYGHKIKCYDKIAQSLSFARRQEIAEMTKEDALLSRDERRELLGYDPDGQPTRVSLNYIEVDLANKYQSAAIQQGKKPTANPADNKEETE